MSSCALVLTTSPKHFSFLLVHTEPSLSNPVYMRQEGMLGFVQKGLYFADAFL